MESDRAGYSETFTVSKASKIEWQDDRPGIVSDPEILTQIGGQRASRGRTVYGLGTEVFQVGAQLISEAEGGSSGGGGRRPRPAWGQLDVLFRAEEVPRGEGRRRRPVHGGQGR